MSADGSTQYESEKRHDVIALARHLSHVLRSLVVDDCRQTRSPASIRQLDSSVHPRWLQAAYLASFRRSGRASSTVYHAYLLFCGLLHMWQQQPASGQVTLMHIQVRAFAPSTRYRSSGMQDVGIGVAAVPHVGHPRCPDNQSRHRVRAPRHTHSIEQWLCVCPDARY